MARTGTDPTRKPHPAHDTERAVALPWHSPKPGHEDTGAPEMVVAITAHPRHLFWADDQPYSAISWKGVIGHRQVTDAYLVALARHRGGALATFDRGLAALHPATVRLIPD